MSALRGWISDDFFMTWCDDVHWQENWHQPVEMAAKSRYETVETDEMKLCGTEIVRFVACVHYVTPFQFLLRCQDWTQLAMPFVLQSVNLQHPGQRHHSRHHPQEVQGPE